MSQEPAASSLLDQVESLYEEKERLNDELGISSIDEAIKMIRSLQDQVESLYEQQDPNQ